MNETKLKINHSKDKNAVPFPYGQILTLAGILIGCAETAPAQSLSAKPEWLPELGLGVSESYDDNVLGVSGLGMRPQSSWATTISPKIGFDFAPLMGAQAPFQKLSLSYDPDFAIFHEAPAEDHDAHNFQTGIKGAAGDFSFSLDNLFIYNDGNKIAPTYALNQLSGPAGNQFDKYRNQFANTPARERRDQVQDRGTTVLQYNLNKFFLRAEGSLLFYNMDTELHNTSKAPYLGYQNYADRSDAHGGPALGYRVMTNLSLTAGYRYGSQFQQQFSPAVSSDSHYASSAYQQVLFGVESTPFKWLTARLEAGPDFRSYNSQAPVANLHPTKYYGEASIAATLSTRQNIAINYKQWNWVASSGYVPEFDSYYDLKYHWSLARQWTFDLDARIQEADYTGGDDTTGAAPSVRAERLYSLSPGVTYAFNPHFSSTLSYTYNAGNNELATIPSSSHPAYKNFTDQVIFLGLLYKF